jgi:hypothetical protein
MALADLDGNPGRHVVLQEFVHGKGRDDGGGCTSHRLLDRLATAVCKHPGRVHLLPGNHELAELTDRAIVKDDESLNDLFAIGILNAWGDDCDDVYEDYLEMFRSMPLAVRTKNRVLMVHTLPPGKTLDDFDPGIFSRFGLPLEEAHRGGHLYNALWGRDVSSETARRFCEIMDVDLLVTGHVPCPQGFNAPNNRQIILDSQKTPAAYLIFPAQEPINHAGLLTRVKILDEIE